MYSRKILRAERGQLIMFLGVTFLVIWTVFSLWWFATRKRRMRQREMLMIEAEAFNSLASEHLGTLESHLNASNLGNSQPVVQAEVHGWVEEAIDAEARLKFLEQQEKLVKWVWLCIFGSLVGVLIAIMM